MKISKYFHTTYVPFSMIDMLTNQNNKEYFCCLYTSYDILISIAYNIRIKSYGSSFTVLYA